MGQGSGRGKAGKPLESPGIVVCEGFTPYVRSNGRRKSYRTPDTDDLDDRPCQNVQSAITLIVPPQGFECNRLVFNSCRTFPQRAGALELTTDASRIHSAKDYRKSSAVGQILKRGGVGLIRRVQTLES